MDKSSTIIMLGIIAATIIPFFIFYLVKKRKDINFLKHFSDFAQKEKVIITQKEFWDHKYVIGIDSNSNKIIYANCLNGEIEKAAVDLNMVGKCRIVTINKANKINGKYPLTDRLELVFTFRNSDSPEKSLKFYENAEFLPSPDEYYHIEKWFRIVSANLK